MDLDIARWILTLGSHSIPHPRQETHVKDVKHKDSKNTKVHKGTYFLGVALCLCVLVVKIYLLFLATTTNLFRLSIIKNMKISYMKRSTVRLPFRAEIMPPVYWWY